MEAKILVLEFVEENSRVALAAEILVLDTFSVALMLRFEVIYKYSNLK
ncbi:MAG: hypothetical protein KA716_23670 [Gloeotrichia echinulata DEX184]|nr:hypothetical protein [Gloeotrichia echinulata DEX184]